MEIPVREHAPRLPSELARIRLIVRPLAVRKYLKSSTEPKLHLGCGPNYKSGWLNADKFDSRADIYLNAHRLLPFPDQAFNFIYSEHTLEHIKISRVKQLLTECHRILKPGGVFRISVPDLELFAKKYVEKDQDFLNTYLKLYQKPIENGDPKYWMVRGLGGVFNTLATRHFFHHRWFYDFETLEHCAKDVGFSLAKKLSFRKTNHGVFQDLDREIRKHESLYAELTK